MGVKIESALYRSAWVTLDWIYPPECGGCGKKGFRWCDDCGGKVVELMDPICEICGQSVAANQSFQGGLCSACRKEKPLFTAMRSFGVFGGTLRNALHSLKYQNNLGLGDVFAQYLLGVYRENGWHVDMIMPVPLSARRMDERGYNQAACLARPLAWDCGLPYYPQALTRQKETASQVGLKLEERKRNVMGAFQAQSQRVRHKIVLLVDDVATTGATINACSQALLEAGASAVFGLTLARAQYGP